MPDRDYSHRATVDKLGIKPGHHVVLVEEAGPIEPALINDVRERTGEPAEDAGTLVDVVLATVDSLPSAIDTLRHWRSKLHPAGAIWLLTAKRGQPGYVNQTDLISAGAAAGLVDNKICSVSDTVSAMRFVMRRSDRPRAQQGTL